METNIEFPIKDKEKGDSVQLNGEIKEQKAGDTHGPGKVPEVFLGAFWGHTGKDTDVHHLCPDGLA
jgi:hypothetical protein